MVFTLFGCSSKEVPPPIAATRSNQANLRNGGRFAQNEDCILGPFFKEDYNLYAYDFQSNIVKQVTSEIAFNIIAPTNEYIYYLNQLNNIMRVSSTGETQEIVKGPISYFCQSEGGTFYCLSINLSDNTSDIIEYSCNGEYIQSIFSCKDKVPSGNFAYGNSTIYIQTDAIDVLEINVNTREINNISNYFAGIPSLERIRDITYSNGYIYFLGQVNNGDYHPYFLYCINISDKKIEQLSSGGVSQYTLDTDNLYFSSGEKIIKINLSDKEDTSVLYEGIYPSSLEILDKYLCCNMGNEFHCEYLYIDKLTGADMGRLT